MFGQPGGFRRRLGEIVAKFREKGATSPEKAMTAQELGLPPRFEEAMKRRLGRTGIFVNVGGKYYLDEARLKQIEERRGGASGAQWTSKRNALGIRMARMIVGLAAIVLALTNIFFVQSEYLRLVVVSLVVLWIILTVFQIYYVSRARSRLREGASPQGNPVSSASIVRN
jgi:hypothetical protein